MDETEIIEKWEKEKYVYNLWGNFVKDKIIDLIDAKLDHNHKAFIKIPFNPRLKDNNSLVTKAFHRGKRYKNPYDEITDKVGIRFVLLLNSDIKKLDEIIEGCELWSAQKDRDYEAERIEKPYEFDYQSMHYILRSNHNSISLCDGVFEGIPCEVQVRTILQHAYAELTHDTIYKPKISISPKIKRISAKSMALIEATSDYFDNAFAEIKELTKKNDDLLLELRNIYFDKVGQMPIESPIGQIIIDYYYGCLDTGDIDIIEDINNIIRNNCHIIEKIKHRKSSSVMYRDAIILLLYFIVDKHHNRINDEAPVSVGDLKEIYTDLGIAFD